MSLRTIKRRRRECKTDYNLRMGLLKSEIPRIVIRRTNKYFIVQLVESEEAKDKVVFGITSKELLNHGWNEKFTGSLKSIPAGYLTGYLFGKKIKKSEYIIDLGMAINHKGGRIYSVVAGIADAGIKIKANESVFPPKEKLFGANVKPEIKSTIEKIKEKIK